jgi:hypothetical protein
MQVCWHQIYDPPPKKKQIKRKEKKRKKTNKNESKIEPVRPFTVSTKKSNTHQCKNKFSV